MSASHYGFNQRTNEVTHAGQITNETIWCQGPLSHRRETGKAGHALQCNELSEHFSIVMHDRTNNGHNTFHKIDSLKKGDRATDRDQHLAQDSAEHYAVYRMAKVAEDRNLAQDSQSDKFLQVLCEYLQERNWRFEQEFARHAKSYIQNVDRQIPRFIDRLAEKYPDRKFLFELNESTYRNQGRKADFLLRLFPDQQDFLVSLKNYVGATGIRSPQVSSGTFLSFANSFVFEKAGVPGQLLDPRPGRDTFKGSDSAERQSVLEFQNRFDFIAPLQKLEDLNAYVRQELLSNEFYDEQHIKSLIAEIVPKAQAALIQIFDLIGAAKLKTSFLLKTGLHGQEELLFFDKTHSVDSLTSKKFAVLYKNLNADETTMTYEKKNSGIHFCFYSQQAALLAAYVPLTINTNGAWYRPKQVFSGTHKVKDKGSFVNLAYGQIRPKKSRELATSTNLYLKLKSTGVLEGS